MTALEKITIAHLEELELIEGAEESTRSIKAKYTAELKSMLTAYFAQINMSDAKWRLRIDDNRIPVTDYLFRRSTPQVKKPLRHFSHMLDQKEYESYSDRNLDVLLRSTYDRCQRDIKQSRSRLTLTKLQQCFKTAIVLHSIRYENYTKRDAVGRADRIANKHMGYSQSVAVPKNLKDLEEIQGYTKKLYCFKSR